MKYLQRIKAQTIFDVVDPEQGVPPVEITVKQLDAEDEIEPASNPIVELLQAALAGEYQQWDLYTSYGSRLKGFSRDAIADEFKNHAEEELVHIELLQRNIVSMGYAPTVMRKSIPDLPANATIKDIVELQLTYEREAVSLYERILGFIDAKDVALKLSIEEILTMEQEHTHDLELLLDAPTLARVMAQIFRPMEAGEPTKPQAGYSCDALESYSSKVQRLWCSKALEELTPDIYARWAQGYTLTVEEKDFIAKALATKWGLLDQRTILQFLGKPNCCK